MEYLAPADFVRRAVDAGQAKVAMPARDTVIRAFMAGAILALAAAFAVTVTVQTGQPLVGALLFPVGFCLLSLLGYDLLTGVFVLTPLAWLDGRPGVTVRSILRNWWIVFLGNFAGALTVAVMIGIVLTFGFSTEPNAVGKQLAKIGEARTVGYAEHGAGGMLALFVRAILCNWMVSTAVIGAMMSTSVPGKVLTMWMPIMLFFFMVFEHAVVNMFLFPAALLMGSSFTVMDYMIWNEIPTILGNLIGGLAFTGLMLYATHIRTGAPLTSAPVEASRDTIEAVPARA